MNGPGHYREAERLAGIYKDAIEAVEKMPTDTEKQRHDRLSQRTDAHALLAKAQVHATLAQAAATALTATGGSERITDWIEAIS